MLSLRSAEPGDVPEIYQMIGELADFEHLRHQVTGTAEDLKGHLFCDSPRVHAVVARWQEAVSGFALYFYNYSTFLCRPGVYLEDLYVRPAFRGHGLGLALLQEVERRARAEGCGRFEWAVLNWNRSAIEFYERFGARANDGWTPYRKEL